MCTPLHLASILRYSALCGLNTQHLCPLQTFEKKKATNKLSFPLVLSAPDVLAMAGVAPADWPNVPEGRIVPPGAEAGAAATNGGAGAAVEGARDQQPEQQQFQPSSSSSNVAGVQSQGGYDLAAVLIHKGTSASHGHYGKLLKECDMRLAESHFTLFATVCLPSSF